MKKTSLLLGITAALYAAPTAMAATPVVHTGGVERAAATGATLQGTVNPRGLATQYRFEYGKTKSYGEATKTKSAGKGTAPVAATGVVVGLAPNTVYHYRVIATNKSGRRNGADRFFRTPVTPVGVTLASSATAPVRFGEPVALSGTVSGVAAGRQVALQQRPAPFTTPFAPLAQAATDAAGAFGFTVSPALNTSYRATAAQGNVPANSNEVLVRVRPLIGFLSSRRVVRRGGKISLRGTVTPAHDGQEVSIQKRNSRGSFSTVARATLSPTTALASGVPRSSYRVSVRVLRSSDYRVRLRAHADHSNGTSRERFLAIRR